MKINPAILKPHPLLALLPYTVVKRLLADTAVTEYPKGTVLFRQGEACDAIYVILSGRCETQVTNGDGAPHTEAVFGPGDTLGERSFLNDEAHRCTAIVSTHGIMLRIPASELEGILTKDPKLAGQFSHAVTRRFRAPGGGKLSESMRVKRIATLLAQAPHADAPAVGHKLAAALRRITNQKVLLLRLAHEGQLSLHPWIFPEPHLSEEFLFERQVQPRPEGYDELRLPVESDRRYAQAIAPLLGECGRHYDYVLVHIDATLPEATILQCIIQADLAYVLLQPSVQNVYDFQLLTNALKAEAPNASNHVKPIVFAESALDLEETHDVLKHLGMSIHSFARGFPQNDTPTWPDKRFDLHINRLAREIGRCRVGLALSSGAAKGLAHAGVIQVLEENGIEVDAIAGASMGAYVGSLWAYGIEGPGLEKIAREHEGRWGLFSLLEPALPPRRGFIHARKVSRRLRRTLGTAHFSDMVRPLRVVSTRLETLERVVFASGEVVQAVEASIAIPGICVPVTIDGEIYVDGGVVDPLPVDVLEEMGMEKIVAVNVIPSSEQLRYWREREAEKNGRRQRFSVRRWLNQQVNYFAAGNVFDTMVQAFNGAQMLVAETTSRRADVVLRPVSCESFWCDFTHPQKYIQLGRDAAEAQLAQLQALIAPASDERPTPSPKTRPAHTPPLREWQLARLRKYLRETVLPFSPYYRELFQREGLEAGSLRRLDDLRRIPFTSKADFKVTAEVPEPVKAFVLQPDAAVLKRRPRTLWRALTRGRAAVAEEFEREFRPLLLTSTTGRSADPVPFLYTAADLENLKLAGRRIMEVCGATREMRMINLFPFAPHLAFWITHYAGTEFGVFVLGTGGGKTMGTEGNLRLIRKIQPEVLIGMPTFLYHMLSEAIREGVEMPKLRKLVLGGEKAPQGMRRKLRALAAQLGAPKIEVLRTYGFTESKLAWAECPFEEDAGSAGYHVHGDLALIEIVDPKTGEPRGEGEPGEIVFTPLQARGSVVLRYRTGDCIDGGLFYEPCPFCGRLVPRLVGEISRSSEFRELRIDKLKGTLVDFNRLEHVLDNFEHIGTWQVELRKRHDDPLECDELVLHVEKTDAFDDARLRDLLMEHFAAELELHPNRVEFHSVEEIRQKQGVGTLLKEQRVIDHRPNAGPGAGQVAAQKR